VSKAANAISPRVTVRRAPKNARYDQGSVYRVLDRGRLAHVSFTVDGQPYSIPTFYARVGDRLLIHGSSASRMLRALASGASVCVTVTILDGLVLARSALAHGANYDSIVLLGRFRSIGDEQQKLDALEAFMEQLLPGRWSEVRPPNRQELKGTAILELPIVEASVKARNGPPGDDAPPDGELDVWAGVIPVVNGYGKLEPSPGLRPDITVSASVAQLVGRAATRRSGHAPPTMSSDGMTVPPTVPTAHTIVLREFDHRSRAADAGSGGRSRFCRTANRQPDEHAALVTTGSDRRPTWT